MLRTFFLPLLITLGFGFALSPLPARSDSAPAKPMTPKQERLKERDRLRQEAKKLYAAGSYADAIPVVAKMLAIDREVFGNVHDDVADALEWLEEMYGYREDFVAARKAAQEVLAIRLKLHGPDHWQTADARRDLEYLDRLERLTGDQRRLLVQASEMINRGHELSQAGNYRDALRLAQRALELRQSVLGQDDLDVAHSLHWLGWLYSELKDYAHAEAAYLRVLAIRKRTLGEKHPAYATALDNLANIYHDQRNYAKAEPLCRQAREIRKETLGVKHTDYATSLHNLAFLYKDMKDYPRAESFFREALQVKKEVVGEKDPSYADTLNALAVLYYERQDYARAEALYRQSLVIRKEAQGETHIEYANTLNNLGIVYKASHDFDRAEACFRQALTIGRQAVGEKHPWYAVTLDNLASVCQDAGDKDTAETLYRQEIDLLKKLGRDKERPYARALNQLGILYSDSGVYAKAEACFQESLDVNKEAVGEKHPNYVVTLQNLAGVYADEKAYDRAVPIMHRVVAIRKEVLGAGDPKYRESEELLLRYLRGAVAAAEGRDDFTAARKICQEVLDLETQFHGKNHWETADARRELAHIDRLEKLTPEQRGRLRQADQLLDKVIQLSRQKKYEEAVSLARQVVELRTAVLGEESQITGAALLWLGHLLNWVHRYEQAELPLRRALASYKQTLGVNHPSYADALDKLALSYSERRENAKAADAYREALAIRKEVLGTKHPDYARSVDNLAVVLDNLAGEQTKQENWAEARKNRQEVVSLQLALRGENHWKITDARLNLAYLNQLEKLDRDQRRCLEEADQLAKKVDELDKREHYREALPLAKRAFEIRKELLGETHFRTVWSFNDLGRLSLGMGDFARAEPILRRCVELATQLYGDKHPTYATDLMNLARLYDEMGSYARAEPLYRQALAIRKELLGEDHRDYAGSLNDLALNCGKRGDPAQEQGDFTSEPIELRG